MARGSHCQFLETDSTDLFFLLDILDKSISCPCPTLSNVPYRSMGASVASIKIASKIGFFGYRYGHVHGHEMDLCKMPNDDFTKTSNWFGSLILPIVYIFFSISLPFVFSRVTLVFSNLIRVYPICEAKSLMRVRW